MGLLYRFMFYILPTFDWSNTDKASSSNTFCVSRTASFGGPLVVQQCSTFHQEVACLCDTTTGFHTLSYFVLSYQPDFFPAYYPTLHMLTIRCKS
jgi:hypothetical protein